MPAQRSNQTQPTPKPGLGGIPPDVSLVKVALKLGASAATQAESLSAPYEQRQPEIIVSEL
jgi:hypothetical protein